MKLFKWNRTDGTQGEGYETKNEKRKTTQEDASQGYDSRGVDKKNERITQT